MSKVEKLLDYITDKRKKEDNWNCVCGRCLYSELLKLSDKEFNEAVE